MKCRTTIVNRDSASLTTKGTKEDVATCKIESYLLVRSYLWLSEKKRSTV